MKQIISRLRSKLTDFILTCVVFIACRSVWAELPTPPASDMANGSKDWIDVGGSLATKALSIVSVIMGAALLVGVAAGTLKSYHVAHERGDLGHFFKMLVVGLLVAAIGIGLLYAGYEIVNS